MNLLALDYIDYQRIMNRVDEDVINEKYDLAINRLDSVYENFDFIYSRHCFKALQICCKTHDSIHAKKWLEKTFLQGVPIWMVRANQLTKNIYNYSALHTTIRQYDSFRSIYKKSINRDLRNQIDSLYEKDQASTYKVNYGFVILRPAYYALQWLKNNKKQFKIINGMIDQYGYPGERLIGLPKSIEDSTQSFEHFNFYGPILGETNAYIMLIHYYSNPRSDINAKLMENVKSGNLPPYQLGALNDFMARWGKKKYGDYQYYNVWNTDSDHSNDLEIEKRRTSIGLNSYEQQSRNQLIMRERRKNKSANSEIILE
jgi:hypothetical protein